MKKNEGKKGENYALIIDGKALRQYLKTQVRPLIANANAESADHFNVFYCRRKEALMP